VTADRSNLLERFIEGLRLRQIAFCLIGGQAVNAYVEPVVSLDLDIVVAADRIADVEALAREMFHAERFPHSLNVSDPDSDVRIQVQLDPRYGAFVERALTRKVLDLDLPVATIEDTLQGKIWAVQDETRRGSKRQKDLADIARIIEAYPQLRRLIPADVLTRLV
jgi:Nucleotidyl transferase AbiEii toxin, Type IV TA system